MAYAQGQNTYPAHTDWLEQNTGGYTGKFVSDPMSLFYPEPSGSGSNFGMPSHHDVAAMYNTALQTVGYGPPEGDIPAYKEPQPWERLQAGDYDKLEQSIYDAGARRLGEDQTTATNRFLANMRKIGMADDPSAQKLLQETVTTPYTRSLTDLSNSAVAQRYGLQSSDLNAYNTGMTERANAQNQYNLPAYTLPRDYYLNKMKLFYQPSTVTTGGSSSYGQSGNSSGGLGGIIGSIFG